MKSPDHPIAKSPDPFVVRFPWNVVHACERARAILPLIEGQLAIGMRPQLLTPDGLTSAQALFAEHSEAPAQPISLLQAWSHVREWRKRLNEASVETQADVIHAHSFASGMAAVRASSGVVYQFRQPIEETANRTAANESNSWLARSFRVAEHFVLTRAAAVVVNNQARREACVAHGVPPQQVFCIPQPLPSELFESVADRNWLTEIAETGSNTLVFAIPSFSASELWQARDAMQRCMRLLSVLLQSCREMKFIILAGPGLSKDLEQLAAACKLTPFMKVVDEKWQSRVIQSADVVICDAVHGRPWEPTDGLQTKMLPALQALARGRALLAADIPEHREISSDGRGCLWFRAADIEDIAHRALFLIQHPRFRQALAAAGRQHCLATRSGEAVAAQYDVVYRLAFSRRKDIDGTSPAPQLIPLEAAS